MNLPVEIPMNQHKYSTGVLLLGPENVHEYFRNLVHVSKFPIISVGSGNGVIERELEAAFGIRIVCVDPTPLSWSLPSTDYRPPDFANMADLATHRPDLVGRCNLFINWAYPTHAYDMEAVMLMQPRNMITICDVGPMRGAGGRMFHSWMQHCGVTTVGGVQEGSAASHHQHMPNFTELPVYNYVFRTWTNYASPHGLVELSCIWLSRDICNPNTASVSTQIANSPLSVAVFAASAAAAAAAAASATTVVSTKKQNESEKEKA